MIFRLLMGLAGIALVGFILTRYGEARYSAGRLAERVVWEQARVKAASKATADQARVTDAVEAYADRVAAIEPVVLHSREVIREYAETDAGRAACLSADRVRGIEEAARALGLTGPAVKSSGPMLAYADTTD